MRILCVTLIALASCAVRANADVKKSEADRLNAAATVVREMRASPDKGISEDLFNRAECVAVIPGLKKGAFIIGGEFGKGVVSCRTGQTWSAPAFLEMEKGSAGLQIGGAQLDVVLLMMNRSALDKLLSDKVNLGADASVAAGPTGKDTAANPAQILSYSRSEGAFAGIDISGGSIRADKGANTDAYGSAVTVKDVLGAQKVAAPPQAAAFLQALGSQSRATTGRK
jgi:lipid-binding SYLF domain-containing protein